MENITPEQFEIVKELNLICSENAFWIFMAMQSIMFKSKNASTIKNQINLFPQSWGNLFSRYYKENEAKIFKINVSNFFETYMLYLNNISEGKYDLCNDLLEQWKYLANILAENFANVNPYWQSMEWRAIINNQIKILDKEMHNNIQGSYSTLSQSYEVYSRVSNDIANYVSSGLIKQFSI